MKKLNVKKNQGPAPAAPLTPEQKEARRLEMIGFAFKELERAAQREEEARAGLLDDFIKARHPADRLEWLDNVAVEMWETYQYAEIRRLLNLPADKYAAFSAPAGSVERLRQVLSEVYKELVDGIMENRDRPCSTSQFSNASMIAKREGLRRALETMKRWMVWIKEEAPAPAAPQAAAIHVFRSYGPVFCVRCSRASVSLNDSGLCLDCYTALAEVK